MNKKFLSILLVSSIILVSQSYATNPRPEGNIKSFSFEKDSLFTSSGDMASSYKNSLYLFGGGQFPTPIQILLNDGTKIDCYYKVGTISDLHPYISLGGITKFHQYENLANITLSDDVTSPSMISDSGVDESVFPKDKKVYGTMEILTNDPQPEDVVDFNFSLSSEDRAIEIRAFNVHMFPNIIYNSSIDMQSDNNTSYCINV